MTSFLRIAFVALSLHLFWSCGSMKSSGTFGSIVRPAENTPETFLTPAGVSLDGNSCKSPMIDARDGTKIIMVSAEDGAGNYSVPEGKYGVGKGELLRLDCATGKVLGIIKK